jgi:hypothetical protein
VELKDFRGIVQAKNKNKLHYFSGGEGLGLTSTANFPTSVRAVVHNPKRISLRNHTQNL